MRKDNTVKLKGDNNLVLQGNEITIIEQKDQIVQLVYEGEFEEAANLLSVYLKIATPDHPYSPYWKYDLSIQNGEIIKKHIPTSKEALEKYPMTHNIVYSIPEKYQGMGSLSQLMNYSYCKQEPIEIDIKVAQTLIGELIVDELKSKDGASYAAMLIPDKFPPPVPMKLYFTNGSFSIDYLELGLVEIDNGAYIFKNSAQERRRFNVTVRMETSKMNYMLNIEINSEFANDVEAIYDMSLFLSESKMGKYLALKLLESGDIFLKSDNFQITDEISEYIRDDLDIYKFLLEIEHEQGVKFYVPEEISEDDYDKFDKLLSIIRGQKITGKYSEMTMSFDNKEGARNLVEKIDDRPDSFLDIISPDCEFSLFNTKFMFKSWTQKFFGVQIVNKPRLLRKLEDMEQGETIKIHLVPLDSSKNNYEEVWIL